MKDEDKDYNYNFWAVLDEEGDIVSVNHPFLGEMKAVFAEKELADKALEISVVRDPSHSQWVVVAVNIFEAED